MDVQIYSTEYNILIDIAESDDVMYLLMSSEQIYDSLAMAFEEKDIRCSRENLAAYELNLPSGR